MVDQGSSLHVPVCTMPSGEIQKLLLLLSSFDAVIGVASCRRKELIKCAFYEQDPFRCCYLLTTCGIHGDHNSVAEKDGNCLLEGAVEM